MDRIKFIILSGLFPVLLFLCSMDAEASASNSITTLSSGNSSSFHKSYVFGLYDDHIVYNGSFYACVAGESNHYKFDTGVLTSVSVTGIPNYTLYDYVSLELWSKISCSLSPNSIVSNMSYDYYLSFSPYVVVNGVKYYLNRDVYSYFEIGYPWANELFYIGADVDLYFNIHGSNISSSPDSIVGSFTLSINSEPIKYQIRGYSYVSSGENKILSKIGNLNTSLSTILGNIYSRLDISLSSFRDIMVTKFDELKQALTRGYDSSGAESTNTELSGSLDSINTAEGTAMTDAKVDVGNYDTASVFNFAPAVISSLSLITTFANSFFRASGDLTTALTVLFALVFISAVVGFLRFVK